jgi:hypothetical protein
MHSPLLGNTGAKRVFLELVDGLEEILQGPLLL